MRSALRVRKGTTSIDVILSGSAPSLAAYSQKSEESPCRRRDPFARLRAGSSLSWRCGVTLGANPLRACPEAPPEYIEGCNEGVTWELIFLRTLRALLSRKRLARGRFALFLTLFILSGCSSTIDLLQSASATPVPVATVIPQQHDLSILGVDFDPPLNYELIVSNGGITLLVAVENRGSFTESGVNLTARLMDRANAAKARELLNETLTLDDVAVGEVRVARFMQVSDLPARDSYHLVVELAPVADEVDTADNYRAYDIVGIVRK